MRVCVRSSMKIKTKDMTPNNSMILHDPSRCYFNSWYLIILNYMTLRAGPAIKMFKRRIGHAPINFTNLDLIFWHGVVHALVDALSVGPMDFFFERREVRPIQQPEKNKIDQNDIILKNKNKNRADTRSLWTYGSNTGSKLSVKFSKLSVASQKCHFFRNYLIYIYGIEFW